MALVYPDSYDDTFIINSVTPEDHEKAEANAIIDADKQGITDAYYLEKIVVAMTYVTLSGLQLEADGMPDKAAFYRKEYARLIRMQRHGDSDSGIFSIELGRA